MTEDRHGDKIAGTFYKQEIETGFRIEKVIKKKGYQLYLKSEGYDHPFNSWIDRSGVKISQYFLKLHRFSDA